MCGIAGILNSKHDVTGLVTTMLSSMKNRGPDGIGLATENDVVYLTSFQNFEPDLINGNCVLGHNRLAIVGGLEGAQPFFGCNKKFSLLHNGEIYNYKILRKKLSEQHEFLTHTDSEVIIHLLEEEYDKNDGDFIDAVKKTINQLDGIFSIAIREESTGTIALIRDRLGVRPLYYVENKEFFIFASEKKAIWSLNINQPISSLTPGYCIVISKGNKIIFHDSILSSWQSQDYYKDKKNIKNPSILYHNTHSAVEAYTTSLINSMKKRTQDFKKIGIIFSGGIDSVIVAYLAKKFVPEVTCFTCGVKDSHDIKFAHYVSKLLDLPLEVKEFSEEEIEKLLPNIMYIIEDSNMGQIEVAIPVYGAINMARDKKIRVMLTGQGADELFGGYSWYPKIIQRKGYTKMLDYMIEDLMLLYKETLEREDKISMANSIEVREPYLDTEVVKTALEINPRLNIRNYKNIPDPLGKRIHRLLAKKIGIPDEISYRIKEAAQHGSGIHFILDKIARRNGYDEMMVTKDYLDNLKTRERIGSSQRYGHFFEKEQIWTIDPHIQLYLDRISQNILPKT